MKRELWLQQKNIKELFELYIFEKDRINKRNAEITQKAIKAELQARVQEAFKIMDYYDAKDINLESLYLCFEQAALKDCNDNAWKNRNK